MLADDGAEFPTPLTATKDAVTVFPAVKPVIVHEYEVVPETKE